MSNGPFVVVGAESDQLDQLMQGARQACDGWTVKSLDRSTRALLARHIYFLLLPPRSAFHFPELDFDGATLLALGDRPGLPSEAEQFVLAHGDHAAFIPMLRALCNRQGSFCRNRRLYDGAAAEISGALTAETADLDGVLAALGPAVGASRVTLFELRRDTLVAQAVHEWSAGPGDSLFRLQRTIDRGVLIWMLAQLELQSRIRIDDMGRLPFTAIEERVLAASRNVQAVLIAPLRSPRGEIRGAIFAEQTETHHPWGSEDERLLLMVGEMLANYLDRKSARDEMREGETVHRQVLDHIQDGVFMAAANGGGFSFVSPAAARMWGMTVEEITAGADNWHQVIHPEDRPRVLARVRTTKGSPSTQEESLEFRILRADDGHERWIRWRSFPVLSTEGRVDRIAGLLEDITERRAQQGRLRLLARVFETTGEAVVITDAESNIIDVNPAFSRITGYERHEVIGRNPRVMSSGRHNHAFYADMWNSLVARRYWYGEIWDRRKDGTEYPKLLTINAILDEDDSVSSYVGVFNDITDVKETEARLQRLAHHDALTGLPNRVLFRDRLDQAVAQALRGGYQLAVMFLDLDGFKEINDRLGHRAGDQLLIEVAQRLRSQVRDSDTVARLGGDEFTAILSQLSDPGGAAAVAGKFLTVLSRPFEIMGHRVQVSASIGISLFPQHAADADGLVRSADGAMYRAKEAGRNRHCFAG